MALIFNRILGFIYLLAHNISREGKMDISQITDFLYVGTQPKGSDYDLLSELNISLIINMRAKHPPSLIPASSAPIETIWLKTRDSVFTPIPIEILSRGVDFALPVIQNGGRVFVHCANGRHRSVAMAAAILIAKGYDVRSSMEILKRRRPVADPESRHIRRIIEKFADYWHRDE